MASELIPPRSTVLRRDQLAQFLPTQELIRAFEDLATDASQTAPANEAEILSIARRALALAGYALASIDALAGAEESFPTPGPRGDVGPAGAAFVLFSEECAQDDPPLPQTAPAPVPVGGSRATDAWRTNLIAALVARGIITDTSTA